VVHPDISQHRVGAERHAAMGPMLASPQAVARRTRPLLAGVRQVTNLQHICCWQVMTKSTERLGCLG
jgi:hypothetical protein